MVSAPFYLDQGWPVPGHGVSGVSGISKYRDILVGRQTRYGAYNASVSHDPSFELIGLFRQTIRRNHLIIKHIPRQFMFHSAKVFSNRLRIFGVTSCPRALKYSTTFMRHWLASLLISISSFSIFKLSCFISKGVSPPFFSIM